MKKVLRDFVIEGVKNTILFHLQLMNDPSYRYGNYSTKFMEAFVMKYSKFKKEIEHINKVYCE